MLADTALPPGLAVPSAVDVVADVAFAAGRWTPALVGHLVAHLAGPGASALAGVADEDLLAAWNGAVGALHDPAAPERRALAPALARTAGLSPAGLDAALEAVLGGVCGEAAEAVVARARGPRGEGLVWVVLAGNVPGLAVQPLLPALARRRPVLVKSSRSEPLFAPALVRALGDRLPALREAVAAVAWPGGDRALEGPVAAAARHVVAYGGGEAIADLAPRVTGELLDYGPKLSLAAVGRAVAPATVAAGLARDVALFDQRGCLSVQAVFTAGAARELAAALAGELRELARRWPPGRVDPATAAAVQQLRAEAQMRGLPVAPTALGEGTVIVEPLPRLVLSPGLRTVRIHPLADLEGLPALLAPWAGRLQGAALAGDDAWALADRLAELGASRLAAPGELQSPDARWLNGGRDLAGLL